jgi:hypothetical protein
MIHISRGHAGPAQSWAGPTRAGALSFLAALALVTMLASSAGAATIHTGAAARVLPAARIAPLPLVASKKKKSKPKHAVKAPVVTAQPTAVFAAPGTYAHFSAGASGYPKPKAQWQISHNHGASWSKIPGATGTKFSFQTVVGQEGDEFRVIFSNKRGRAASDAALLSVVAGYALPAIATQPQSTTVPAGADAIFTATASGYPVPTVQWQLSGDGGTTWSDVSGATTTTLEFNASTVLNNYEFRAVFTNVLGTVATSAATLTVSGSTSTVPVITTQPENVDLTSGGAASFTAAAAGSPTPTVQWEISSNAGATWTPIPGATSTTYSFPVNPNQNLNEYEAVFTNVAGSATTDPAILGVDYALTTNWAGWAATGNAPYTSVTGTWTVPTVSCPSGLAGSDSSQWVGIDGAISSTVEQIGTYANCGGAGGTTPTYGAWYEMLGDQAVNDGDEYDITANDPTDYPVAAGDAMTATVSYDGISQWTLTINDTTQPWGAPYTATVDWTAPADASAEWIVERPLVCAGSTCALSTLADFGGTTFTNASATADGTPGTIEELGGVPVDMIRSDSNSTLLADPGPLTGGDSFTVSWVNGS